MTLLTHTNLFTPWQDQESGVAFHILNESVAPLQKGFYFVNDSMSKDCRFLWFCCAYPPSLKKMLALIDFEKGSCRFFPDTQFDGESPYVDTDTGEVYWTTGDSLWKKDPIDHADSVLVNSVPEEIIGSQFPATLLAFSHHKR